MANASTMHIDVLQLWVHCFEFQKLCEHQMSCSFQSCFFGLFQVSFFSFSDRPHCSPIPFMCLKRFDFCSKCLLFVPSIFFKLALLLRCFLQVTWPCTASAHFGVAAKLSFQDSNSYIYREILNYKYGMANGPQEQQLSTLGV